MAKQHPHVEIINLWPTAPAFARDVGKAAEEEVNPDAVRQMRRQGIPERLWHATVSAAAACGFPDLTYARLAELNRQPADA